MALPLVAPIYWGILLLGGVTAVALQELSEEEIELELGRIDLDDLLDRAPDPDQDPDPEREPVLDAGSITRLLGREALRQIIETQTRARTDLDENDCEDCLRCKPYDEGGAVTHNFSAGTLRKPNPRGKGSLYQHYVVPWFAMRGWDTGGGNLRVEIEEWEWRRGRQGSWDGLDFATCTLMEVKLGYRDFMDPSLVGETSYDIPHPRKRFLGSLNDKFSDQLTAQASLVLAAGLPTSLEWVFSDDEVKWQFSAMTRDYGFPFVKFRTQSFPLAPSGTEFVRELYSDGPELYGYWEDVT